MYDNDSNYELFSRGNTTTELGNEIVKRILFFNWFLNIATLPNKVIIFMTDMKKEIDNDVVSHMHFKTINVNTAVTNGQDIIIYREQELLKSIFHELIHFHNLDFRNIPKFIVNYLIKTHNITPDNEYLLYECATELLANILNNIYMSRDMNIFIKNFEDELQFSTLQVSKILNICGYKEWNEFARIDNWQYYTNSSSSSRQIKYTHIHNNDNDIDSKSKTSNTSNPKKHFKQDSCVFSYYILKFYIMLNLDIYFKHSLDNKLKFIQTEESFNNLITIFNNARGNHILKQIMDILLKGKSNVKSKATKRQQLKINTTLRMTCIENNLLTKNSI